MSLRCWRLQVRLRTALLSMCALSVALLRPEAVAEGSAFKFLMALRLQQVQHRAAHAGSACRALRTAAASEQLWQQHCNKRWKYPNKHLRRAGASLLSS